MAPIYNDVFLSSLAYYQLGWVIILIATDVYHLYIARLIIGIAGAGAFGK